MVGLSVCLSVTVVSPAKTAEPIEIPFGLRIRVASRNYTPCPEKWNHSIFASDFADCWPIFKILSPADLVVIFEDCCYKIFHCTSTDKPWVTPSFRRLIRSRQRAFLSGDVSGYHRLRNRTQRMASTIRKKNILLPKLNSSIHVIPISGGAKHNVC